MNKTDNILLNVPNHNHSEPEVKIDKEEFIKVVESRRSVRVFKKDSIKEEHIKECLELALLAPTSSNLQCWEFYWVRSKDKKEKLKTYCLGQLAARTAQELIVCVARTDTWKQNKNKILKYLQENNSKSKSALSYYQKIVPLVYTQGPFGILGFMKKILIFFIGMFKVVPREPTSLSDMRVWAHKTTALACENLMLALRAYGYDSCPMEGMDSKKIGKMLKLTNKSEVCMVIGIGKREKNGIYSKRFRLDSKDFIKIV